MNKKFVATKFSSSEFADALEKVIAPYRGNQNPIIKTLEALGKNPLNCKSVVFEYDYVDKDYQNEFAAFYSKAFKKYEARAVRLHFFSTDVQLQDLPDIDKNQGHYLGFLVIRPTDLQRVGRTMIKPNLSDKDREFVHCCATYHAHILGRKLIVDCMPFIQQDTQVGACAHAALWMLARYMSRRFGHREFLPAEINQFAKVKGALGRPLPAEFGLTIEQMLDALDGMGFSAISYSVSSLNGCADHIDVAFQGKPVPDGTSIQSIKLADIAYRYIESGLPVIEVASN